MSARVAVDRMGALNTLRTFLTAVSLAILWVTLIPVPASSQAQRSLRDWQVSCDANGSCMAETTATGRTDAITYRFTLTFRRAAMDAPWRVSIRMRGEEPARTSALIFQIDAGANFRFEPDEIVRSNDQDYELTGQQKIDALMDAFRDGDKLWLTFHSPRISETGLAFSLSGVVASIIWIEEQQSAGAPTAQIPDRIIRMQALDPNCERADMPGIFAPERHQVAVNQWLHIIPCNFGAYNLVLRLYIENREFDEIRPLFFATYSDDNGWGGTNALINADFDAETKILTSFNRGRGLGDCGSFAKYEWNEYDFKLLEFRYWEACDGTHMPADWPVIYLAEK